MRGEQGAEASPEWLDELLGESVHLGRRVHGYDTAIGCMSRADRWHGRQLR